MALLRRTLIASGVASDLRPVMRGLARRGYRRLAVATPSPAARPLGADLLVSTPEARLWITWASSRRWLRASAVLAVGLEGPDPAALLAEAGWRSATLPLAFARALLWPAAPVALPSALPFEGEPFVLLPPCRASAVLAPPGDLAVVEGGAYASECGAGGPDLAGAADRLAALVADCVPAPDPLVGPATRAEAPAIGLERCAEILGRAIAEAQREDRPPAQRGLTVSRLRGCGATRPEARAVMLWLASAGAIEPPRDPRAQWREPRALVAGELAELLALLAAAPAPDGRAAEASFARQEG
jgi:hypothetical protein